MRSRSAPRRQKIDSQWVLRQAVALYQRCVQEIKPALHPKTRRQMTDEDGRPLFTFNAAVAARALELVGKHCEVGAFEDRVKHDTSEELIKALQAGRQRALETGRKRVGLEPVEDAEN
jgi:hypothetical protein